VFAAYRDYPAQSLQSDEARALLHHLVVMRRPEFALEIGTYRAGTTEVLARALWEAGRGHLDTIDPFGAERCPPLIQALPEELRQRVTFRPVNSAAHFDQAINRGLFYDFVLIDGSHEFEFALFDLLCSARLVRPRGIVVLDNIEQPGPLFATRAFLRDNPAWVDVARVVRRPPSAPFEEAEPSFPDTKFYVLQAPDHYVVGGVPRSFGAINSDFRPVEGVQLELASPARGTVHVQVILRTFGLAAPEQIAASGSYPVKLGRRDDRVLRLAFDRPLRGVAQADGLQRRIEIVLAFTGRSHLALAGLPLPYPAQYA
jgi:predicted O-methyltransferase YrrM